MRISDWSSDVCSSDLRTGRQFIFDLAVVAVDRRLELLRQDHEQDDARRKGEEADADDPDAMIEQPRPKAPDHEDRPMGKGPLAHPRGKGQRAEQERNQAGREIRKGGGEGKGVDVRLEL